MKRWMKQAAALGLSMTLALSAVGCSDEGEKKVGDPVAEGDKVVVYTTLQVHGDFVREIGKDKVEVNTFMPLGTNFWQWAPTLKEMRDLESADALVLNGGGVEDRWFEQTWAQVKIKNKDLLVINAAEGLASEPIQRFYNPDASEEEQKKERVDPWFYLDPQNAIKQVDTITKDLSDKAPAYAEEFKKNAEAYKQKLGDLDKNYKDVLTNAKHKEIVSPYGAYQYLAKRYGLKFYATHLIAINDIPDLDPVKMQAIKEDLAKHDAKTIFFEGEAAPRVQEELAKMGYKSKILDPYEGKQPADKYKSYLQVMETNLQTLKEALN